MTSRKWAIFLAIVFAAFLALEFYSLATGTPTLSQAVWSLSDRIHWIGYPITFAAGFVGGHWFWGR